MNDERELWEKRMRAREEQKEKELDILGDATVRPLKKKAPEPMEPVEKNDRAENKAELKAAAARRTALRKDETETELGTRTASRQLEKPKEREAADKTASHKFASGKVSAEHKTERKSVSRRTVLEKGEAERKSRVKVEREPKLASRQTASSEEESGTGVGVGSSMVRRQLEEAAAKKKKRRRLITMIIAECIALFLIFGYAYVARQLNKLQRPEDFKISELETNELNVETVETMKGYWTIAIFGVDARNNAINKGTNADVNMICNINRDTGEIKLISVFRDTYLNISEGGSYNKLNQAYFIGGPEQAVQALNRNLDLQINDYMTFNWKAVADAINILGGVDIELSDAEFYYINGFITETVKATGVASKHLTHSGMNHLDGVQAVAYGRLRLMDTDFARTERQRKVIAQAFQKAKSADFKTLNTLIGTVFPQVSTSVWVDDLVANAKNISKFHLGETTGFPQARGDVNMGKKGSVVVPQTLETNVVKLHEFLFGDESYAPSQTVKNISAKISADTGMYKEGKYIEHVNTEGVIQKPKATAAAKKEETKQEETKKEEKKTTEAETDENGNPIEAETDEDGNLMETETDEESSQTESETDEDGNPIESENGHGVTRPTTSPIPGTRPAASETDGDEEPSESETDEEEEPVRPTNSSTKPTNSVKPTTSAKPTTTSKPTSTEATASSNHSSASGPGSSTEKAPGGSGNGVVSAPGAEPSSAETVPALPMPGQNVQDTIKGPTSSSTGTTSAIPAPPSSGNGAVAGPGQ